MWVTAATLYLESVTSCASLSTFTHSAWNVLRITLSQIGLSINSKMRESRRFLLGTWSSLLSGSGKIRFSDYRGNSLIVGNLLHDLYRQSKFHQLTHITGCPGVRKWVDCDPFALFIHPIADSNFPDDSRSNDMEAFCTTIPLGCLKLSRASPTRASHAFI